MSGGYESTCPRCGAMLTSGGCLSCGYPAGSLRDKVAADTVLAEKSKGDTPLGHVRIESLIEAFENLAYVRQQLSDTKQQLEETKWECRNLEAERDEARRELFEAEDAIREADRIMAAAETGEPRESIWRLIRSAKAWRLVQLAVRRALDRKAT